MARLEALYGELQLPFSRGAPGSEVKLGQLQIELGSAIPNELRAAWLSVDGLGEHRTVFARPGRLTGYAFMSGDEALRAREALRQRAPRYLGYVEPKPRDARIRAGWYQSGWLPFGAFGGDSLRLILDLTPSGAGSSGQVIAFTHDPDRIEFVSTLAEIPASLRGLDRVRRSAIAGVRRRADGSRG